VYGNTVEGNVGGGIQETQINRGSGAQGYYAVHDVHVHIRQRRLGRLADTAKRHDRARLVPDLHPA
jgi:hypothetical protein